MNCYACGGTGKELPATSNAEPVQSRGPTRDEVAEALMRMMLLIDREVRGGEEKVWNTMGGSAMAESLRILARLDMVEIEYENGNHMYARRRHD